MGDKKQIPTRVLVLRAEQSDGFGHISGFVSHASKSSDSGFASDCYGPDKDILDVTMWSQCSGDSQTMYAERVEYYTGRSVGIDEARKAIRVLAPIRARLDAMYASEGPHASFGAFVNRAARALKAQSVILRADDGQWRAFALSESVMAADRMAANIVAETKRKAA